MSFADCAADVCCSDAHDISVRHLMMDVMSVILRESEHIPKELVEGILLQLLTSDEVREALAIQAATLLSEVHHTCCSTCRRRPVNSWQKHSSRGLHLIWSHTFDR